MMSGCADAGVSLEPVKLRHSLKINNLLCVLFRSKAAAIELISYRMTTALALVENVNFVNYCIIYRIR